MDHLDPVAAHAFLQREPRALLVDCRTEVEYMCVGHPVGAEHIAWQEAPNWQVDPHFADKVRHLLVGDMSRPVLLICRSGIDNVCASRIGSMSRRARSDAILESTPSGGSGRRNERTGVNSPSATPASVG